MPSFGAELRRLREQRGLSLAALAGVLHYSKGYLSKIENNLKPATVEFARNAERALDVEGGLVGLVSQPGPRPRGVTVLKPAQLPTGVDGFVGRAGDLDHLGTMLTGCRDAAAVPIVVINGSPGVGKTSLALRWAHSIKDRFTDGALFANLRGYDPDGVPAEPAEILDDFLRALGVPAANIPSGTRARATLFRTMLDGKRTLVVLDNVTDADQVRPLLPGCPDCMVVVTSRSRLSGLVARDGAVRITLEPLPAEDAVMLLRRVIGADRVDAEPEVAAELAWRCAHLPLALRIAAERVASRPHMALADLAGELVLERDRLDTLSVDDDESSAVRAVFSWSYRALPPEAARLFRLLGLHVGAELSTETAAALAELSTIRARRILDTLAGVHLIAEVGRDRYRMHDLLRVYAAERCEAGDPPADRIRAVDRVLGFYLHTADGATRILGPQRTHVPLDEPPTGCAPIEFSTYGQALDWCDTELQNLIAATRLAARSERHAIGWRLPIVLWDYFQLRNPWDAWITMHNVGLTCARRVEDATGEAWTLHNLAYAYWHLRRLDESHDSFSQALRIRERLSDRWGQAWSRTGLGVTCLDLNRFDEALAHFTESRRLFDALEYRHGQAVANAYAAGASRSLDRTEDALIHLRDALSVFREIGDRAGEGYCLSNIGEMLHDAGRSEEGLAHIESALLVRREAGERSGEAESLRMKARLLDDIGRTTDAATSLTSALRILEDLDDPRADEVRAELALLGTDPEILRPRRVEDAG